MVSDQQVKRLWRLTQTWSLEVAAAKAGMDPKTARKYLRARRLPSEMRQKHTWRTRPDPFAEVWDEVEQLLKVEPGLQAKTIFEYLQEKDPGRFSEGQVRTLQRRIKIWRALEGPPREIFFAQDHYPGELCQSDFTHCRELGITINGQLFPHLIYHFVLSYSNWETGTICYSETFESLSEGLQNALWELGGVPHEHRSDRMSAAVNNLVDSREFTRAYEGLLRHYGLTGQKIQAGEAHENGDIEQRHYRFKQAVDQALMMRGSRDFASVAAYDQFLRKLFAKMNAGRRERFAEELLQLRPLPEQRLDSINKVLVIRATFGGRRFKLKFDNAFSAGMRDGSASAQSASAADPRTRASPTLIGKLIAQGFAFGQPRRFFVTLPHGSQSQFRQCICECGFDICDVCCHHAAVPSVQSSSSNTASDTGSTSTVVNSGGAPCSVSLATVSAFSGSRRPSSTRMVSSTNASLRLAASARISRYSFAPRFGPCSCRSAS
jgi:hypothetical protein